ncbi:hypothetical protein [Modestobacter roseus]|uniref:hypothetical protein n=1 Tax=Modestobacter roseus TaxID=1181884 RepID=UPI0012960A5A|nr:hypothetical protein [Modestobacter roseus]MQA36164.1 hypothetical protein [Modestobacter roseus]
MTVDRVVDELRAAIKSFLCDRGLTSVVSVRDFTDEAGPATSVTPRAEGGADVLIIFDSHGPDSFGLEIYVAGDATPIEISGPVDRNNDPPGRRASDLMLEILEQVSLGLVYEEFDEWGEAVGVNVPSDAEFGDVEGHEGRQYSPWR